MTSIECIPRPSARDTDEVLIFSQGGARDIAMDKKKLPRNYDEHENLMVVSQIHASCAVGGNHHRRREPTCMRTYTTCHYI